MQWDLNNHWNNWSYLLKDDERVTDITPPPTQITVHAIICSAISCLVTFQNQCRGNNMSMWRRLASVSLADRWEDSLRPQIKFGRCLHCSKTFIICSSVYPNVTLWELTVLLSLDLCSTLATQVQLFLYNLLTICWNANKTNVLIFDCILQKERIMKRSELISYEVFCF